MQMPTKITCDRIKEGVMFSSPVFFDDGENMFLAANRPAKKYHIHALKRWNIPFLVTDGHEIKAAEVNAFASRPAAVSIPADDVEDLEVLEELEELEEL